MNDQPNKSSIGNRVLRREDQYLLRGLGQYLDDLPVPKGTIHLGFVSSSYPHAKLKSIDISAAHALPGVIDVLTGKSFLDDITPLAPDIEIAGYKEVRRPVIAVDKVHFVGEYVAVILAESPYIAQDAIELVDVEYEPLPAVAGIKYALEGDAPVIHDILTDNVLFESHFKTEEFEKFFTGSDLVIKEEFRTGRVTGVPMEPRGCLAIPDPIADSYTLWTPTQIPHIVRTAVAMHLDIPESIIRVATPTVGGGFGTKAQVYPDELIVVALARRYRRPIKWVQDRREELLSNAHAREHIYQIEVAVNSDGTIAALKLNLMTNAGAYSSHPFACTLEATGGARMLPGPYKIRNYKYDVVAVATNTAPTGAYRGVAQPSCFFAIEGIMDRIARTINVDPAEVRRRNLVQPEDFPYRNVVGVRYDVGSYLESMERALEVSQYNNYRKVQLENRLVDGKYRGIGIGNYTEVSGTSAEGWRLRGFSKMPGFDSCRVCIEPDGRVTVYVSQADAGQGHYTTFAQVAAHELGISCDEVTVVEGDTAKTPYGTGTFASRSSVVGGGSIIRCCQKVIEKACRIARGMSDSQSGNFILRNGYIYDQDNPEIRLSLRQVAETAYAMNNLAIPNAEDHGLEATDYYDPPMVTMANGTHVIQVAIDAEDGRIEIENYVLIHDCGRVINPMIVEGQLQGATAQGIGEALMEEIVYDENGQLLNANLLDYILPTSLDIPDIKIGEIQSPSIDAIGGFKGTGEAGLTGAIPALANAVSDALAGLYIDIAQIPLRPSFVTEQIRSAETKHQQPVKENMTEELVRQN